MNITEALSKLELEEGATSSEITTQYQEFYNEFQMRITNAPTEHQRKLYQKKLEELAAAFEVLGGENPESNTQELPGISVSEVVETEKRAKSSASNSAEMSKEKALQILGLGEKFTEKELENAVRSKVSSCEAGKDNTINDSIRVGYEDAIIELKAAHKLLKGHVYIPTPKSKVSITEPFGKNNMAALNKKWALPVSIVGGVIILVILFFTFSNGTSITDKLNDPATHDKYVSLKSQADLLAKQDNWQEALTKYNEAYDIVETTEVKDSVESMKKNLLLASIKKNGDSDEQIKATNKGKKQEAEENALKRERELVNFKKDLENREYAIKEDERLRKEKEDEENALRREQEVRENAMKEAERLRKEKESKRIKIGDTYAGGIVFKVDASGEHGLVCAVKDQGKCYWNVAKTLCQNLTLNGYSDWYMPSLDELKLMYLKIGNGSNLGDLGGFGRGRYWSSYEVQDGKGAMLQNFDGGSAGNADKDFDFPVRAIRAF